LPTRPFDFDDLPFPHDIDFGDLTNWFGGFNFDEFVGGFDFPEDTANDVERPHHGPHHDHGPRPDWQIEADLGDPGDHGFHFDWNENWDTSAPIDEWRPEWWPGDDETPTDETPTDETPQESDEPLDPTNDSGGVTTNVDRLEPMDAANEFEVLDQNEATEEDSYVGDVVIQLPAGNLVSVTLEGSDVVVRQDDAEVERIPLAQIHSLSFQGSDGDDSIEVDFSQRQTWISSIEFNLGAGNDSIHVSGLAKRLTASFTINGDDGDDTMTMGYSSPGSATLNGNGGNDSLTAGGGNDAVHGGSGDDWLDGGRKRDTMRGGSGNDLLFGRGGRDRLYAGDGDDYLNGNGGHDTLRGNGGHDNLRGASGHDLLIGGAGNDFMQGGEGNDTLSGNDGNDSMNGGSGNDGLSGGNGDDDLRGERGRDTLLAGDGDDIAMGGIGRDIVLGGRGNDHVDGEQTRGDTINGGEGDDNVVGPAFEIDEDYYFFAEWADRV
jgi:Ca2+-binding RTX toxin-like protein